MLRGLDLSGTVKRDVETTVNCLTTTSVGFLDFIKLFYLPVVIQLFIIMTLVGFMHVIFEPFVWLE